MTTLPDGFVWEDSKDARPSAEVSPLPEGFEWEQPNQTGDIAKSFASGVGKGVSGLVGLPGNLQWLTEKGADYVGSKVAPMLGMPSTPVEDTRPKTALQKIRESIPGLPHLPTSEGVQKGIENVTGPFYQPQTTAGKYASSIGEFVPGALAAPEGMVSGLLKYGVAPGVASEFAGEKFEGSGYEDVARTVAGLVAPTLAARSITMLPASAERQAAVNALRNEGIQPTAGQTTGSNLLQHIEGESGGAKRIAESADRDFTRAALSRTGVSNPALADSATMQRMDQEIGNEFNRLTAAHDMPFTGPIGQQAQNDLLSAVTDYHHYGPSPDRARVITNIMNDISADAAANGGMLPGRQYQNYRSRLGSYAASTDDPEYARTLARMRNALDNAMEARIQQVGPETDVGAFRDVRNRYRNALTIKRSIGTDDKSSLGFINPKRLANSVKAVQGTDDYVHGLGQLAELAKSGSAILKPLPEAPGLLAQLAEHVPLAGALGIGGHEAGGLLGTALGAASGIAATRAGIGALGSRPVQAYLRNQAVQNAPLSDNRAKQLLWAKALSQGSEEARKRIRITPAGPAVISR